MSYPEPSSPLNTERAAPADPYLTRLGDEDRESYRLFTGTNDLTTEIRLMRTMLARLCADIPGNWRAIGSIFAVLLRAVTLQSRRSGDISDLEEALTRAAEEVLEREQRPETFP